MVEVEGLKVAQPELTIQNALKSRMTTWVAGAAGVEVVQRAKQWESTVRFQKRYVRPASQRIGPRNH